MAAGERSEGDWRNAPRPVHLGIAASIDISSAVTDSQLVSAPIKTSPPSPAILLLAPVVGLGIWLMMLVRSEPHPKPLEYVTIGLVFGTFFGYSLLAGAWVALGPLPLVWRLPLSLVWLALSIGALAINASSFGPGDWEVIVYFACASFGMWLLAQFPLWALAVGYGLRVRNLRAGGLAHHRQEQQFGIRQLLIVTTIVAVVLGIGRYIVSGVTSQINLDAGPLVIISFLAIAGLIMTLPLLLAALLPRYALPATAVVLVLIALGTATELPLLTTLNPAAGGGPHVWHFYGIHSFQCFWVLTVTGVLRWAGYRLAAANSSSGVE